MRRGIPFVDYKPFKYPGHKPSNNRCDPAKGSHIPGGKRREIKRNITAEYEQEMNEQSEGT